MCGESLNVAECEFDLAHLKTGLVLFHLKYFRFDVSASRKNLCTFFFLPAKPELNCCWWQVRATEIIAEEEIEQIWHDLVGSVSASLSVKSLSGQKTGVKHWRAPLYDIEVGYSVRHTRL
jgi:hypothetical protein